MCRCELLRATVKQRDIVVDVHEVLAYYSFTVSYNGTLGVLHNPHEESPGLQPITWCYLLPRPAVSTERPILKYQHRF